MLVVTILKGRGGGEAALRFTELSKIEIYLDSSYYLPQECIPVYKRSRTTGTY